MALSKGRILLPGQSEYPWEQEGLDFIRRTLPDNNPFCTWELVELPNPQSGQVHEIDCFVLGYKALYLIEMKAGPGLYEGDTTDWFRTPPGGVARYMEPPYRLTSRKARIVKGMLERASRGNRDVRIPYVQPLVFLTAEDLDLRFRNHGDFCVVTRQTFLRAVQYHEFPGCEEQPTLPKVSVPQMRAVRAAFDGLNVRPSAGALEVTSYKLQEVIGEGPGYEDRIAKHTSIQTMRKRARVYLVPQQTSPEHRQRLRRAAEREVHLLDEVKDHPNVLRMVEYVPDAPLGPTVLFDHFDGMPLDAFMRTNPDLPFADRVTLIEQIGNTLAHCHRKQVLHGALCPSAVLVRREDDGTFAIRLFNFQLGEGKGVSATVHWSALGAEPWAAYQAPELRTDPSARSEMNDVFSLGALAYFVLTGVDPAKDGVDLDLRLEKERSLDPRVVNNDIDSEVADAIRFATDLSPIARADNVEDWLRNIFLESATAPERPAAPTLDPLTAKKEDLLDGALLVERVLGQGASARVLQVYSEQHERSLALKVALTDADGDRLQEEGRLLDVCHHARIVQFFERREIAGRTCLLMAVAGDASLRQRLRKEGPLSLDYAARFGEDLLSALEHLEEEHILHRDIKPDNIGVGTTSHRAQHLVLFDFSLAVDVTNPEKCVAKLKELGAGTSGYRDPFMRQRGAWDHAADRWAATITLHEMLTGVAPSWLPDGVAPWVDEARLNLAAERFDPSVREQLTKFFERALRPTAETRFEKAADMRRAWNLAFEAPAQASVRGAAVAPAVAVAAAVAEQDAEVEQARLQAADLSRIAADASIQLLPLSNRAKNALDRAGLTKVSQLLELPDNRLSAVRGVGTEVTKEILRFRDEWQSATHAERSEAELFHPGYRGEDARLATRELSPVAVRVFEDAGLLTLFTLAVAPRSQVEALAARARLTIGALTKLFDAPPASKKEAHPTSLDAWLTALLPKPSPRREHLEMTFGLSAPLLGKLDVTQAEAAHALRVTPAALSSALTEAAKTWAKYPHLAELTSLVHGLLASDTPALLGTDAAQALAQRLGETTIDELTRCKAAALIRIVCAVERGEASAPRWVRIADRAWLVADESLTTPLRELGQAADELAARTPIGSAGETARTLQAVVEGTRLARSSDEALAQLATKAAKNAACSSRLEIYPRGMPATRALELTSSVLSGELTSERIRQLVSQRYPEAEPLPERPELDALLAEHELQWNGTTDKYHRKGAQLTQLSMAATSLPDKLTSRHSARSINPERVAVKDFEDQVALSIERKSVRVLGASQTHARAMALALAEQFGLHIVNLDQLFLSRLDQLIAEEGISKAELWQADAEGPGGEMWAELAEIMQEISKSIVGELLPFKEPTLLVQPGILARFGLTTFLLELFDKASGPHSAATLLLIPRAGTEGTAQINQTLTIPHVGLPNTLDIPLQWLTQRVAA